MRMRRQLRRHVCWKPFAKHVTRLNVTSTGIVSRAYHDSLFMSRIAPMAMIFIPCRDGVSHRPDEYAAHQDIVAGINVLARTLGELIDRCRLGRLGMLWTDAESRPPCYHGALFCDGVSRCPLLLSLLFLPFPNV